MIMATPDFQATMLPILQIAEDGQEHSLRDTVEAVAARLGLSEPDRKALLPSGRQSMLANRVGWARTYMAKAGLLEPTRRGHFRITARGRDVLARKPAAINSAFLGQFAEFREFKALRHDPEFSDDQQDAGRLDTPEELIEAVHQKLRDALATELLQAVADCSPAFFERLVVDLLVRMGYGGTRKDAGEAIGQAGDGGIDGIIKEDRLGLDIVYVQAKRWDRGTAVGRPEIQKFAGALQGHRARKGVFLTTSSFTKDAQDYVSRIDSKIVLIDGDTLARLMIDFGIGVAPVASYELKRLDSDYFVEE
jgi:restriction system protein